MAGRSVGRLLQNYTADRFMLQNILLTVEGCIIVAEWSEWLFGKLLFYLQIIE